MLVTHRGTNEHGESVKMRKGREKETGEWRVSRVKESKGRRKGIGHIKKGNEGEKGEGERKRKWRATQGCRGSKRMRRRKGMGHINNMFNDGWKRQEQREGRVGEWDVQDAAEVLVCVRNCVMVWVRR